MLHQSDQPASAAPVAEVSNNTCQLQVSTDSTVQATISWCLRLYSARCRRTNANPIGEILTVPVLSSLLITTLFAVNAKPKLPSPQEQMAREMLANFNGSRFVAASADFNDDLRPQITPVLLARVKDDINAKVGTFETVTAVHHLTQDGFRVVELIAKFDKGSVSVRVVFDMSNKIGAVFFNPILPPPVDKELETMSRELLANIEAGKFDDAAKHFDDTMRKQLTPANLADLQSKIATTFGKLQSITEVRQRIEAPYKIIDVIAVCDHSPLAFRVAFDAANRIAAVHISPNTSQ